MATETTTHWVAATQLPGFYCARWGMCKVAVCVVPTAFRPPLCITHAQQPQQEALTQRWALLAQATAPFPRGRPRCIQDRKARLRCDLRRPARVSVGLPRRGRKVCARPISAVCLCACLHSVVAGWMSTPPPRSPAGPPLRRSFPDVPLRCPTLLNVLRCDAQRPSCRSAQADENQGGGLAPHGILCR